MSQILSASAVDAEAASVSSAPPMVSIIICAYNTEQFLNKCLDSILKQTYHDYEIIVVNDGSTDGTQHVIDGYLSAYPALIKSFIQKNSGPSAARNVGMAVASGKYISFIDSDDWIAPDFLEKLFCAAEKNQAQVVSCGFNMVKNGSITSYHKASDWDVHIGAQVYSLMCVICTRLYRRDFLEKYNLKFFKREFYEDVAFSLCVNMLADKIISLPLQGYFYRIRDQSTMNKAKKGFIYPDQLPFRGIEQAIIKISSHIPASKKSVFEFALIKSLAGLTFQVLRKNNKETVRAMTSFCSKTMDRYCPDVMKNPYIKLFKVRDLPFLQRAAIFVFKNIYHAGVLYPISYFVTRF